MEITFMTPNAVSPSLAAACAPSVTVSPRNRAVIGGHATRGFAAPAVAGLLPVAQLPALRQLAWTPIEIKAAAPAGAMTLKSTTPSTTSTTLAYRVQESTGVKLDGFGGVPPRGKPKV
ncbi:hypothetical protein CS0771_19860 [Catellatospora sp. IY07-71]|uniref:hypothetical protein n=1 Tax=Catellatospora sp. IY07-71 TaxID=2728827 RepID=UPI001BB3DB74|nr:hypothetical protein [Catellatospora sp. IY07-71]BCJ72442.1 hypothetical protein CS0771_19860 [Catellatospora sp. IY07-71]